MSGIFPTISTDHLTSVLARTKHSGTENCSSGRFFPWVFVLPLCVFFIVSGVKLIGLETLNERDGHLREAVVCIRRGSIVTYTGRSITSLRLLLQRIGVSLDAFSLRCSYRVRPSTVLAESDDPRGVDATYEPCVYATNDPSLHLSLPRPYSEVSKDRGRVLP